MKFRKGLGAHSATLEMKSNEEFRKILMTPRPEATGKYNHLRPPTLSTTPSAKDGKPATKKKTVPRRKREPNPIKQRFEREHGAQDELQLGPYRDRAKERREGKIMEDEDILPTKSDPLLPTLDLALLDRIRNERNGNSEKELTPKGPTFHSEMARNIYHIFETEKTPPKSVDLFENGRTTLVFHLNEPGKEIPTKIVKKDAVHTERMAVSFDSTVIDRLTSIMNYLAPIESKPQQTSGETTPPSKAENFSIFGDQTGEYVCTPSDKQKEMEASQRSKSLHELEMARDGHVQNGMYFQPDRRNVEKTPSDTENAILNLMAAVSAASKKGTAEKPPVSKQARARKEPKSLAEELKEDMAEPLVEEQEDIGPARPPPGVMYTPYPEAEEVGRQPSPKRRRTEKSTTTTPSAGVAMVRQRRLTKQEERDRGWTTLFRREERWRVRPQEKEDKAEKRKREELAEIEYSECYQRDYVPMSAEVVEEEDRLGGDKLRPLEFETDEEWEEYRKRRKEAEEEEAKREKKRARFTKTPKSRDAKLNQQLKNIERINQRKDKEKAKGVSTAVTASPNT